MYEKLDNSQIVYTLSSPPGRDADIYVEPHTWVELSELYDFDHDENAPTVYDSRAEAELFLITITGDVADA